MKTMKLILTNLILVLTLVILTSGCVFASQFTAKLEKDGYYYNLIFPMTLKNMEKYNAEGAFIIRLLDSETEKIIYEDKSYGFWGAPKGDTIQIDEEVLAPYDKIKIRFDSEKSGTKLNEETIIVPKEKTDWDVDIQIKRDAQNIPTSYSLIFKKNNIAVGLDELEDYHINISNADYNDKLVVDMWISTPGDGQSWEDAVDVVSSRVDFGYYETTKKIVFSPNGTPGLPGEYALGEVVNKLLVIIEDPDGKTYSITKEFKVAIDADFKVIPSFISNTPSYILQVEKTNFSLLGEAGLYKNGSSSLNEKIDYIIDVQSKYCRLEKSYQPGDIYTIKSLSNGQNFGSVTIPNISKITLESANKDSDEPEFIFKKIDRFNKESIMSISEMQSLGWTNIEFENMSSKKKNVLNLSTMSFDNGAQIVDNQKIVLLEKGGYTVTIKNPLNENVFKSNTFAIDHSVFNVKLERESINYKLIFDYTLKQLEGYNAGKAFKVHMIDPQTNEEIGSVDSYGKALGFLWNFSIDDSEIGVDEKLYKYEKVLIKFDSDETNLYKEIELDVPQLTELSLLEAKISKTGTVDIYNKETKEIIPAEELEAILGYDPKELSTREPEYKLCHNKNGLHVLDSRKKPLNLNNNKVSIEYEKYTNFEDNLQGNFGNGGFDINDVIDQQVLFNFQTIFDYYNIVKANGDVELYIQTTDYKGNIVEFKIIQPQAGDVALQGLSGAHPYYEAITGTNLSRMDAIMATIESMLQQNATFVKDGILEIDYTEEEKLFYLPSNGIYFIYEEATNTIPYITISSLIDEGVIANAGRFTGEEKEGKKIGEYVFYNNVAKSITFGTESAQANCYPLIGGAIYKIENLSNIDMKVIFQKLNVNGDGSEADLVEISDEEIIGQTLGGGITFQHERSGYEAVQVAYILMDDAEYFPSLGGLIARFIRNLANGLIQLVQSSLQSVTGNGSSTVDIDKILFNHYPDTSIAFFNSNKNSAQGSEMIEMFKDGVNTWYSVFRTIAISGYLVVLLYIGVKILLGVGDNKKAKYKEMLTYWLTGLILLVFFPYVVKYCIDINDLFVAMIEDSKASALQLPTVNSDVVVNNDMLPSSTNVDSYYAVAAEMDNNPFSSSDTSYMAVMAERAHKTGGIVEAFVYLIMVWQFIMIIILYYKRVFTIAFLMAIFPFVALLYVIDKLGDGKSQAFSVWAKEVMINIFIQSIHAIVYVFVIGATYSAGTYSGDWLLSIIGISFLFQGEQILKKIIGQSGEGTVKSLAKTAAKTVATVTAVRAVTKNVANNYIGANSHLGRTVRTYRQYRTEKLISKNMNILAPQMPKAEVPAGNMLRSFDPMMNADEAYNDLADGIQSVNNWQDEDPEKLGKALETVMRNRNSNDANIQNLMKDLRLSDDQLLALSKAYTGMTESFLDADPKDIDEYYKVKETIDKELDMKLQFIFPGNELLQQKMKRAMYYRMRNGDVTLKRGKRSTDRMEVRKQLKDAENRRKGFFNPDLIEKNGIGNPFALEENDVPLSDKAVKKSELIVSTFAPGKSMSNASETEIRMAQSLARLNDFKNLNHSLGTNSYKYTAKQLMEDVNFVAEHENDSNEFKNAVMNTLNLDAEEVKAIVSEQVLREYTDMGDPLNEKERTAASRRKGKGYRNSPVNQAQRRAVDPEQNRVNASSNIPAQTNGNTSVDNIKAPKEEIKVKARDVSTDKKSYMQNKKIQQDVNKALNMAVANVNEDEKKAEGRMCYEESMDGRVSVKDWLRKERDTYYNAETLADCIVEERENRNLEEIAMLQDLAREQLDDLPELSEAPTYKGLTQEEHENKAKELRRKVVEELSKTEATTAGILLGAPIGAGLAIGMSDDESAFTEAMTGASVGILAGDYLAEHSIGTDQKTKKVKIINPYTREVEEFDLKTEGVTADSTLISSIKPGEILRPDDPRLNYFKYNLEIQYLDNKQKKEEAKEIERRRNLFNDALRNNYRN